MSLAVWLGEDRKCSAAVVGLDLLLGLSMVRRCSLNRSFKPFYVVPVSASIFLILYVKPVRSLLIQRTPAGSSLRLLA